MSTFLEREAVRRLCGGKVKFAAQRRALERLGYRLGTHYTLSDAGEPLVYASVLDGTTPKARNRGPKWHRMTS